MINEKLYQCLVLIILPSLLAAITPEMTDPLMDLYKKYQVAYTGSKGISLRRFLKNNNEYQNHVKRLKDVNGFKAHNMALRNGDQPEANKTMYVNNPVEAKLPQAFISFDEFKQALVERVQKDKDALKKSNLRALISKKWIVTTKRRPRTIKTEDVLKEGKNQNRESEDIGPILGDLQLKQKRLKIDRIKNITPNYKGRASQKKTPNNLKSTIKIYKDVSIKHTIKSVRVQSRGSRNITEKHLNFTKKNKNFLKKDTSNFLKLRNSGPVLSDSIKNALTKHGINHITVSLKAQSKEPDITTNPAKPTTSVKITKKQNTKNIDVKITKPSQNIARDVIKSIIKDQFEISPIPDFKEQKMSAKDADTGLVSSTNAYYVTAKGTAVEHVTETTENAASSTTSPFSTSSTTTSITTESRTAKKLESGVEMEMTTKTLPNSGSTKSTVTTLLENVTESTVSTLSDESETVTDSAIRATEITTNVTESATNVTESATNVTEIATNAKEVAATEFESRSTETEEEEEYDTEAPITTTPTTTTVLTQRTLGRPRVFMGR